MLIATYARCPTFTYIRQPCSLPTWGRLLNDAKDRINLNIWLVAGPGLLLSATVMSVNLIGDGLRDALDPQTRSKG